MTATLAEAEIETQEFLTVKTDHLITEDDAPVDNLFSEKQQRLLTEPLYTSWPGPGDDRPFLVTANVGLFMVNQNPAIVPDVLLSLDVVMPEDWWSMEGRSYAVWQLGKTPDLVVEIVSNRKGDELGDKLRKYEQLRVPIYVVLDPDRQIQ
ncbi:MAG: Uma2 family endonuclease, partial [Caldilineaceae bacterium]|nr:Uma2 family endonuclease [Caldilineaceae bacterium]